MSHAAGRSKKNQITDANHVSARIKAEQRRATVHQQEEHNDGRKYDGKVY